MKCDRNRIAHTKWKCKTTNWGCIYLCYPTILVVTWQQGQFKTAHSRKRSTLLTLAYVLNSYCLSSLIPYGTNKSLESNPVTKYDMSNPLSCDDPLSHSPLACEPLQFHYSTPPLFIYYFLPIYIKYIFLLASFTIYIYSPLLN